MNAKERDNIFQQWRSLIAREGRDLDSLERISARALQDRDIRADAQLQSMLQDELGRRRTELQRGQQSEQRNQPSSKPPSKCRPSASQRDDPSWRASPDLASEFQPAARPAPPDTAPPPPDPVQETFDGLAQTLNGWLARGDEDEARAIYEEMRALQGESRGEIPTAALQPYEQKVAKLRTRLGQYRVQIAALVQQAIAASRNGDERSAATLMRRLSAIHVSYPHLLDEARLDEIRADIVDANEQHDDGLTARRLIERERAVAVEIRKIAAAVHEFYRVVCEVPNSSEEFRSAEAAYLLTLQQVRTHDPEWLAGFILELADLLAEWRMPPGAAGKQIDRFLENVRQSMKRIHAEMDRIDNKRDEAEES